MNLVTNSRAFRLVRRESGDYLMEIRDMRRAQRCGFRLAVARLARLYRGAIRAAR